MSDQDRIRTVFQDLNNEEATNLLYVDPAVTDATLSSLALIWVPLTAANVQQLRRDHAVEGPDVASGGTGPYSTHRDMVTFQFKAADGSKQPVTVAGPEAGIFLSDNETVDPADVDVIDLVNWCLANATTATGADLIEFERGWRWYLSE